MPSGFSHRHFLSLDMNSAPDAILHYVLSRISDARDLARCCCVSKRWKDCVPYLPSLYFARHTFDRMPERNGDAMISKMICRSVLLEELIIYCPFSASSLSCWIALRARSLRRLELRLDSGCHLECLSAAAGLETLKLWGVCLAAPPNWKPFLNLRVLEVVGAAFGDLALAETLKSCPNLTDLALLGCDGVESLAVNMSRLEKCRLDFIGARSRALYVCCPNIRLLEVQGFGFVVLKKTLLLRSLSISKTAGKMEMVEIERLPAIQFLAMRGLQWSWKAITSVLNCASEVKHLVMKIEFSGDSDQLQPFPPVDLVEFFNAHLKLRVFEIHGALFASLCQKDGLQTVDSKFEITSLEEIFITVRSPLNAEQKLSTLESLVKYSPRLRRMIIRLSQMKNCNEMADDFFEDICKLKSINTHKIHIE